MALMAQSCAQQACYNVSFSGASMYLHPPRQDNQTAQQIKEALAMQRAFGNHAAATFLRLRNVSAEVAARVLSAPGRRRKC